MRDKDRLIDVEGRDGWSTYQSWSTNLRRSSQTQQILTAKLAYRWRTEGLDVIVGATPVRRVSSSQGNRWMTSLVLERNPVAWKQSIGLHLLKTITTTAYGKPYSKSKGVFFLNIYFKNISLQIELLSYSNKWKWHWTSHFQEQNLLYM